VGAKLNQPKITDHKFEPRQEIKIQMNHLQPGSTCNLGSTRSMSGKLPTYSEFELSCKASVADGPYLQQFTTVRHVAQK
jgi:hypothetical protein